MSWFASILTSVSLDGTGWTQAGPPRMVEGNYVFEATSEAPIDACKANPQGALLLPKIPYARQEVRLENSAPLVPKGGIEVAGVPVLYTDYFPCSWLREAQTVTWRVILPSIFLGNFSAVPHISNGFGLEQAALDLLGLALALTAGIVGFLLMLLALGKTRISVALGLFICSIALPLYSILLNFSDPRYVSDLFLNLRISFTGVWVGAPIFLYCMRQRNFIDRYSFGLTAILTPCALIVLWFADTVDVAISASSLMHIGVVPCLFSVVGYMIRSVRAGTTGNARLQVVCLLIFVLTALFEVLKLYGGYIISLFEIGLIAGLVAIFISINDEVLETYRDREALRDEVARGREEALRMRAQEVRYQSMVRVSQMVAHDLQRPISLLSGFITIVEQAKSYSQFQQVFSKYRASIRAIVEETKNTIGEILYRIANLLHS